MKKHIWHCGICGNDLTKLKKGKGTIYLYCNECDKMIAYHNKGLLKKIGKGALRSIPGGDIVVEALSKDKSTSPPQTASPARSRMTEVEKLERYIELNKKR